MTYKKKVMVFDSELNPGERLLWSGRPQQGIMFRSTDLFMIPFSLLWGGFACMWTVAATSGGGCFGLFGVPFVMVGFYMIAGRFYADSVQRSHTYYALTGERIIIITGLFSRQVKSIHLKTLSDITLNVRDDGTGTIVFGPEPPMAGWYRGMSWPGTGKYVAPAFEAIQDARYVYNQIRQAQNAVL